jgi:galactokinase
VNLIGEHTDYTGGLVLPMAIPFASVAEIGPAHPEASYTFISETFAGQRSFPVGERPSRAGKWSDYPVGVLLQLLDRGITPPPFTLRLRGEVPFGAGLSSSASIEVATAMALLHHANATLPPEEIALLCRRAENDYVRSPCGIMDQFVVTAARAQHALLLDTRSLRYELLPMDRGTFHDARIVIINSTVRHSIANGDYGLRRRELEAGQAILRSAFPEAEDLGAATLAQLEACRAQMSAESYHRCRHIISENARVRTAREALLGGDAAAFGVAMHGSHVSQRDDFACSCEEIDYLVETAQSLAGCYGARLTGGGFGGCTVNLVALPQVEAFQQSIRAAYKARFSIDPPTYVCEAADGAVALAERAAA